MGSAELKCPRYANMISNTITKNIPAWTSPGLKRSASFIAHQDNNEKLATEEYKIKTRRNETYIGTWNVRTLLEDGKLEELTHELDRYRWNVLGLSEVRKRGVNEIQTKEGHKLYYIGNDKKHVNGVGFVIHSEITRMVMCFNPINERLATIILQETPFNISIIQVYAPTTDHSDEEIELFYNELQDSISKISKKDILVIQGDWNAKIDNDAIIYWGRTFLQFNNKRERLSTPGICKNK